MRNVVWALKFHIVVTFLLHPARFFSGKTHILEENVVPAIGRRRAATATAADGGIGGYPVPQW